MYRKLDQVNSANLLFELRSMDIMIYECTGYWVFTGQYWLVFDGTGSVWGVTGCNLVVLGQYNLVLIRIEWYLVNKGLLCL